MSRTPVLLMVRELGLGGTERQLTEIARSLDRRFFEPHVACFKQDGFRSKELNAAGVPVIRLPAHSFCEPSVFQALSRMGEYVRRNQVQIVHAFDSPMTLFGVPAARALGVRRVLSSQRVHRALRSNARRHLFRLTDHVADGIVVNCLSVCHELIENDKVPARRIHLCRNGIDLNEFRPRRAPRPAPLQDACLVVGVVCALRPEKDLGTLLRAFAQVRHIQRGLKLVIVGNGPARETLEGLRGELGLLGDCCFEPATARVADWLAAIDIFVLPSLSEALSNSLMEAMACGCCVIASRTGGNPELIADRENGLLFHPGDAEALAALLGAVIASEAMRRELGRAAAHSIATNFSIAQSARRMEEIYTQVLEAA